MPLRPCPYPRCPEFAETGYCPKHSDTTARAGNARERNLKYARAGWRKLRERLLAERPLCQDCNWEASSEIHHVTKLADGGTDEDTNLMALCKACHSKRTAKGE